MNLDEFRSRFNAAVRGTTSLTTVTAGGPLSTGQILSKLDQLHQRMRGARKSDELYDLVDEYLLYAARLAQTLGTASARMSIAASFVPGGSVLSAAISAVGGLRGSLSG